MLAELFLADLLFTWPLSPGHELAVASVFAVEVLLDKRGDKNKHFAQNLFLDVSNDDDDDDDDFGQQNQTV